MLDNSRQQRGRRRGCTNALAEGPSTLADLRPGRTARIARVADDAARAQALRFGVGEGASVECVLTLPGGPVVLRVGRQEIAVGRGLATRVLVDLAEGRR